MNNFIVIPLKYNQKINQGVLTLLKLKLIILTVSKFSYITVCKNCIEN